jgi:hypothetical protein
MEEEQPKRRRRPALSCLACRRRKIKCDRASPCARCISTSTQCTYRGRGGESLVIVPSSPQDGEGYATSASPRTSRTSPVAQARAVNGDMPTTRHGFYPPTPAAAGTAARSARVDHSDGANHSGTGTPALVQEAVPGFQDLRQRVRKLEQLSVLGPVHALAETGRHILTRQIGLQDSEVALKKSRLLRWSDWIGIAPEVDRHAPQRQRLLTNQSSSSNLFINALKRSWAASAAQILHLTLMR